MQSRESGSKYRPQLETLSSRLECENSLRWTSCGQEKDVTLFNRSLQPAGSCGILSVRIRAVADADSVTNAKATDVDKEDKV